MHIEKILKEEKIDIGVFIETGTYNDKKPILPISMNKMINNNITHKDPCKHQTPLGAGTVIQANSKIIL